MGIFDDPAVRSALDAARAAMMTYNIDTNSLTPEEQDAYKKAIDKAVAENRSLNVYGQSKFAGNPKRYAKSVEEQRNIMALGIPPTTDLWGDLDPAYEISNRIPGSKLENQMYLGETYGMFNPYIPDRTEEGLGIGLNFDKLGNDVISDMSRDNAPVEEYKNRFQQAAFGLMNHEREHTYTHARSPFAHPTQIVAEYVKALPEERRKATLLGIIGVNNSFKNLDKSLADFYRPSAMLDPSLALGLFEEASARAASEEGFGWIKDESAKEELKKYIKWKRTGLFE